MNIPSSFNPRGKTNAQLADEFGVSVRTISRWKAAMRDAPVKVAEVELTTEPAPAPENVKYQHVISPAFVNIVRIEGSNVETVVILSSDQRYQKAVDLIAAHASLEEFFVKAKLRRAAIHTNNEVTIDENGVLYKDFKLQGEMADAITLMFIEGRLDANSNLVHFIDNLVQNPDSRVLAQLYPFVQHNDIKISDDGYILAYKKVREDYKDIHSGTMDNSPGKVLEMPRNMVENDPDKTCAAGLHVCAKAYLEHFGSTNDRVVMVKVHPKDVVSVPYDYDGAKMRACRYEVLLELDDDEI